VIDGVGPEIFTFRELVQTIGAAIGVPRPLVPVPPWFGYFTARLLGHLTGDVLLTRDEIRGLMKNLLYVESPPTGGTRLSAWLQQHAESLGRNYESELARRK
ncbi:MAG TPA: epimerase, partial [bacterium]|nr:epimerase [bacterium]